PPLPSLPLSLVPLPSPSLGQRVAAPPVPAPVLPLAVTGVAKSYWGLMLTFGGRTERRGWWVYFFFFVGKNTWAPFPLQVSVSTGTAELWGRVRPRVFFFDVTPTAARCTAASGVLHVLHTTASALFRPSLPRRGRLTVVLYDECVVCWRGERALRDRFAMLGLVEHQSRGTVLER
ncbi:unnamed protein product, partial [Heterosigma akashiwo]